MSGPTCQAVMATMVTSTKKVTIKGIGSGAKFPGPNGKKPGGNGWKGGDREAEVFTGDLQDHDVGCAGGHRDDVCSSFSLHMSSEEQRQPVAMPRMFLRQHRADPVSSVTFEKAKRSLQREHTRAYTRWLLLTLVLGFGFLVSQLVAGGNLQEPASTSQVIREALFSIWQRRSRRAPGWRHWLDVLSGDQRPPAVPLVE